jgi:hypothetical protein
VFATSPRHETHDLVVTQVTEKLASLRKPRTINAFGTQMVQTSFATGEPVWYVRLTPVLDLFVWNNVDMSVAHRHGRAWRWYANFHRCADLAHAHNLSHDTTEIADMFKTMGAVNNVNRCVRKRQNEVAAIEINNDIRLDRNTAGKMIGVLTIDIDPINATRIAAATKIDLYNFAVHLPHAGNTESDQTS